MKAWQWWALSAILSAASGIATVMAGRREIRDRNASVWDDALADAPKPEVTADGVSGAS